jgi:hypothetical protein
VSIFASVNHADLEGHLPKMAQLDWKILSTNSNRLKEEDQIPKQVMFFRQTFLGWVLLS